MNEIQSIEKGEKENLKQRRKNTKKGTIRIRITKKNIETVHIQANTKIQRKKINYHRCKYFTVIVILLIMYAHSHTHRLANNFIYTEENWNTERLKVIFFSSLRILQNKVYMYMFESR